MEDFSRRPHRKLPSTFGGFSKEGRRNINSSSRPAKLDQARVPGKSVTSPGVSGRVMRYPELRLRLRQEPSHFRASLPRISHKRLVNRSCLSAAGVGCQSRNKTTAFVAVL